MKNILNKYVYLSLVLVLSLGISSCDDDDNYGSDAPKVIPIVKGIAGETVAFIGDTYTYTLNPYRGGSDYIWSVSGAEIQPIEGRKDQVNVLFNQFDQPVSLSVYEMAFNGLSSDPVAIDITVFGTPCDWTLEAIDTYGDGWDGAYIELSYSNITQQYTIDGPAETFTIPIPEGQDYTFTYVPGNYEEEHRFTLTSPDGTVVAEEGCPDYGCEPTPGLIISGTNICN